MTSAPPRGAIICAGLGPGDPELISLKAARVISGARHIAYFRKRGRKGHARTIAAALIPPGAIEHAMDYPVTTELAFDSAEYDAALAAFYDDWAQRLAALAESETVVVLCEGDPFFYGSFMHLHVRLAGKVPLTVIPGITGMSGCWTACGLPMAWGDDVTSILAGTLPEAVLVARMDGADALVVMKLGRNLEKVRRALRAAGRDEDAFVIEYGTMAKERVRPLTAVGAEELPYFSMLLVQGRGRRPGKEAGA